MPLVTAFDQYMKHIAIQSITICTIGIIGMAIAANEFFRALFYILGLLLLSVIWMFIAPLVSLNTFTIPHDRSLVCNISSIFPQSARTAPAWSTSLLTFSFIYLLIPILINGYNRIPFIILSIIFIFMDAGIRWKSLKCTAPGARGLFDIICGMGFGGLMGALWYFTVHLINPNFTFYSETKSNKLKCEKPNKKNMKCTVYRNGVKTGSILH